MKISLLMPAGSQRITPTMSPAGRIQLYHLIAALGGWVWNLSDRAYTDQGPAAFKDSSDTLNKGVQSPKVVQQR